MVMLSRSFFLWSCVELDPMREKYEEYMSKPGFLQEVLEDGANRARKIASETVSEVRSAIGISGIS